MGWDMACSHKTEHVALSADIESIGTPNVCTPEAEINASGDERQGKARIEFEGQGGESLGGGEGGRRQICLP